MERVRGLIVVATIAAAAMFLHEHYGAPVMLFALLLGMAFHFLTEDERCRPGIEFSAKTLLRVGIVFLGARITTGDIAKLGWETVAAVVLLVAFTIGVGFICARIFDRGWRFALLTGGSVAICGASAALAIASVIPHNDKTERNTLFTVIAVTALSTIAMVLYPILFSTLGLSERGTGLLIGATIHDVAQVVGAGYSVSTLAGDTATIVKLLRVSLLPVVLIVILLALRGRGSSKDVQFPLFVVGFAAVTTLNSLGLIPGLVRDGMVVSSQWLLVAAISAIGIKTSLRDTLGLGPRHAGVVIAETLALLGAALAIAALGFAAI